MRPIQFQPILRLEQLRDDGLHEKYQHQRPFWKFSTAIRVSESFFCLAKFGFYEEKSSIKSQKHGAASTFKQPRKVMRSRNVWASYVKDAKFQEALKTVTMILESIGIQQSVFSWKYALFFEFRISTHPSLPEPSDVYLISHSFENKLQQNPESW